MSKIKYPLIQLFSVGALCILPSCASRVPLSAVKQNSVEIWDGATAPRNYQSGKIDADLAAKIVEKEARLNVPLPLQVIPYVDYFKDTPASDNSGDQNALMVAYTTRMSREQLVQFYNLQMECFGWKKVFTYNGIESVLVFQRPEGGIDRFCFVTLRPHKRYGNQLIISAGCMLNDQKSFSFD